MVDETQAPPDEQQDQQSDETEAAREAAEAPPVAAEPSAAAPADSPVAPAEPPPAAPRPARPTKSKGPPGLIQFQGTGRRKTAVARVYLRPGNGRWRINGRELEDYFPRPALRQAAEQPFAATDTEGQYDIKVRVNGGGSRGQAEAIRLGVARALLEADEDYRRPLRAAALLTRDARKVERKKPGRPKARKRFQFSKR